MYFQLIDVFLVWQYCYQYLLFQMQQSRKNLYQTLGLTKYATQQDIKKAYKKLAMLHHPDKNIEKLQSSINIFRQISHAYEILSDTDKRRDYDLQLLYNYGIESEQKINTFDFRDAQEVYQKFRQNLHNRYYSKGQDEINSHMNGSRRVQKRSTNFNFPQYSQTPRQSTPYSTSHINYSYFKQKDTNQQDFKMSNSYLQDLGVDQISKSTSLFTKSINGKIVVIKRITTKKRDGTKEIIEETIDDGHVETKLFSLGVGEGFIDRKAVSHTEE